MKKLYSCLGTLVLLLTFATTQAQVLVIEDFEDGANVFDFPGWNTTAPPFSIVDQDVCEGSQSLSANLFNGNPSVLLEYSSETAAGDDIQVSFDYKIVDSSGDPVTGNFGELALSYSVDAGTNWILYDLIDQSDVPTSDCSTHTYTLSAANVPAGSDFSWRLDASWNTGDYYVFVDNFRAVEQVDCIMPVNLDIDDEESITFNSVDISWEDLNSPSAGEWVVTYCLAEGDPDINPTCMQVTVTGDPETTLTGLINGTDYYVYVKSNCNPIESVWSDVLSFQTRAIGSDCNDPIEINANPTVPSPTDLPFSHASETGIYADDFSGTPGGSCGGGGDFLDGYEVVYRYVPEVDDILTIEVEDLDTGSEVAVFVYEDCDDIGDFCVGGDTTNNGSDLLVHSLFVDEGQEYYIVIASVGANGEPLSTNYTFNIGGFDCNNWVSPNGDSTALFVTGQPLDNFSGTSMGANATINGAVLTWYEDDNGVMGDEVTDDLDTVMIQDNDVYWVTQSVFGCESPALQITFEEFNCATDLGGITSTQDAVVCDEGQATIQASANTSVIYWYDAPTDGEIVGSGNTFNTPVIDQTTSYWASEAFIGEGQLYNQASVGPTTGTTSTDSNGVVFNATQPFTLVSIQVYVSGPGGNMTIELQDENQTPLESMVVSVSGGTTASPTLNTINLFWELPSAGTYRLVKNSGPSMVYESSPSFPYSLGNAGEVVSGATTSGSSSGAYYYFFNWTITSPMVLCESPRTEVEVVVYETQPVSISADDLLVCVGDSTQLTAQSNDTGYTYQWSWSDGDGSHSDSGATIEVFPIENTVYEVTGTNALTGCTASYEIEISTLGIDHMPMSPEDAEVCVGEMIELSAGGLNYDFEEANTGWSTANDNSVVDPTVLNPASANWNIVESPHGPTGGVTSNDNSSFYISIADKLGPGGNLESDLISPSFNLVGVDNATLEFYHYHRYLETQPTEGVVSVNPNGQGWEVVKTYSAGVGAPDNFAFESIDISAYAGYSDVQVRFRFQGEWGWYWAIDNVSLRRSYLSGEVVWYPTTDLYLDRAGNTPYNGTPTNEVFFNGSSEGQFTYTATLDINDCSVIPEDITITVNETLMPSGDEEQSFNLGGTIGDLVVTGDDLSWYVSDGDGGFRPVFSNYLLEHGETYYVNQTQNGCESDFLEVTAYFECPVPTDFEMEHMMNSAGNTVETVVMWTEPEDADGVEDYHLVIMDMDGTVVYEDFIPAGTDFDIIEGLSVNEGYTLEIYSICDYDFPNYSLVESFEFNVELSVDSADFEGLSYYPNPTEGVVYFENTLAIDHIEVFSITGQRIFEQQVSGQRVQVDLTGLATGAYFVNVSSGDSTHVVRILKE